MRNWLKILLLLLPLVATADDELLMARSQLAFPEAMQQLQESIKGYGYTVSRVQRVDVGLTTMGYQTDKYRVVFFAKYPQMKEMAAREGNGGTPSRGHTLSASEDRHLRRGR